MALNVDFAPTFLDAAGLPPSRPTCRAAACCRCCAASTPADWRTSMYYRYYHDPGDHNTRAHYGVRTRTHKLIYFWKKDQWELFDLVNDPSRAAQPVRRSPDRRQLTATLKAELARLKQAVRDDDQLANEQLPNGVDGPSRSCAASERAGPRNCSRRRPGVPPKQAPCACQDDAPPVQHRWLVYGAALTRTSAARELLLSIVSVTCASPSATAIR